MWTLTLLIALADGKVLNQSIPAPSEQACFTGKAQAEAKPATLMAICMPKEASK